MKVYRNLEISVPRDRQDEFLSRLEAGLTSGWTRDSEAEEQHREAYGDTPYFYFACDSRENRGAALLALVQKEESILYVSNIVPRESSSLNEDQYNQILMDFCEISLFPLAEELAFEIVITEDEETLGNWISSESTEMFRKFSVLANKSTGSSHPSDKLRWFDFVISIFNQGDELNSETFRQWLIEDDGWTARVANKLAIEYEQAIGLLNYFHGR